jgi:hypothetical protein
MMISIIEFLQHFGELGAQFLIQYKDIKVLVMHYVFKIRKLVLIP